jgi:hypothetical protein
MLLYQIDLVHEPLFSLLPCTHWKADVHLPVDSRTTLLTGGTTCGFQGSDRKLDL